MRTITHLGRVIDLRYPSNLYALVVAGGFALAAWFTDVSPLASGGSAFLAWALARELDPDRVLTANIAAIAGGAAPLLLGGASLGAIYLFLVSARIVVRSTGLAPKPSDLAVHVLIAGFVARSTVGWVAALAFASAVALDARSAPAAPKSQYAWAAVTALVATAVAAFFGLELWTEGAPGAWGFVAAGVVGGLAAIPDGPVESKADMTRELLRATRVSLARRTALIGASAVTLLTLAPGAAAIAPVWATLAVAGLVRLLSR